MRTEIKYNLSEKVVIYCLSVVIGSLSLVVALFLAASVCLAVDLSNNFSTLVSGICLGIGAAVSGFLSSKKIKSQGIVNGLFCGVILYFFIFLLSLFFSENSFSIITLSHLMISLLAAAIGGVLGVNTSKNKYK